MQKFTLLMWALAGTIFGVAATFAAWTVVPKLHLPRTSPLYKQLGIYKPQVIGFTPYWLLGKTTTENQKLLTSTTYFGLEINEDGTLVQRVNDKEEEPGWTKLRSDILNSTLTQAKAKQNELSILLHNSTESEIATLIENPEDHAKRLTSEAIPLMRDHGFTDLNLDIESFREASDEAQIKFTHFLQEVKTQLTIQNAGTLTVELTPAALVKNHLSDPIQIGNIADRVILMAYDYHYRGSFISGPVAPIGGGRDIREYDVEMSVQEALKKIPARKLILGIPLYGYEWETISRHPGAPVIPGSGKTASNTRVEDLLPTCVHCEKALDPISQQPYIIEPATQDGYTNQIFYEDEESLQRKLILVQKYRLGGVAFWAMGYEGKQILNPLNAYINSLQITGP